MTEEQVDREARRLAEIALRNKRRIGGADASLVEDALRELLRVGAIPVPQH